MAEGETSSETSVGSDSPPCDLGLVERLLRTHPVWFLPGIQRAGAVHLLQGKEEGVSVHYSGFYFILLIQGSLDRNIFVDLVTWTCFGWACCMFYV